MQCDMVLGKSLKVILPTYPPGAAPEKLNAELGFERRAAGASCSPFAIHGAG